MIGSLLNRVKRARRDQAGLRHGLTAFVDARVFASETFCPTRTLVVNNRAVPLKG